MESNDLKEKIRKNLKEEIAISNIRKEFDMKTSKNKKIIYAISSACAVFTLGIGIIIGTNTLNNIQVKNEPYQVGDSQQEKQNKEDLEVELNINNINDMAQKRLDADVKTSNDIFMPAFGFLIEGKIPSDLDKNNCYAVFIKSSNSNEYDVLNCYVLNYSSTPNEREIRLAFSDKSKPIRDYYLDEVNKTSKIGGAEIKISQYQKMYLAEFYYKGVYFDIETDGITENELVDLLTSIIKGLEKYGYLYTP